MDGEEEHHGGKSMPAASEGAKRERRRQGHMLDKTGGRGIGSSFLLLVHAPVFTAVHPMI